MKVKHIGLAAIAVLLAISIMASPAMCECEPPPPPCPPPPPPCPPPCGESPGYWRNEVRRFVDQGRQVHEEVIAAGGIVALTAEINGAGALGSGMWYMDHWLPLLPDTDSDGVFTIDDAYEIFWNGPSSSTYKPVWKGLANWYNWAIGWAPVDG